MGTTRQPHDPAHGRRPNVTSGSTRGPARRSARCQRPRAISVQQVSRRARASGGNGPFPTAAAAALEVLEARVAEEDRRHRVRGQREAKRRLDQARRMALLDQHPEGAGPADVGGVVGARGDRIDGRDGDRVTRELAGQRSRGQHPDHHYPHPLLAGAARGDGRNPGPGTRRHGEARARVQQVEAHLRRVHRPCRKHPVNRRRVADRRHPDEPDLARPAQGLERRAGCARGPPPLRAGRQRARCAPGRGAGGDRLDPAGAGGGSSRESA